MPQRAKSQKRQSKLLPNQIKKQNTLRTKTQHKCAKCSNVNKQKKTKAANNKLENQKKKIHANMLYPKTKYETKCDD